MEEQNIFWKKFDEKFKYIMGKKIVLYGIGEKTEIVVQNAKNYNIIGLMDQNCVGMTIYGKKVLSIAETKEKAEVIIIVANLQSCPIIFSRIKELANDDGILIYYINGIKPDIENSETEEPKKTFDYSDLYEKINQNEIISFDIFDTLLMRRTLLVTDIFELVENEIKKILPDTTHFKKLRILAEKKCYESGNKYFSIDDIYDVIQLETGLQSSQIDLIKQIEFEMESKLLVIRKEIVKIYEYVKKANKKILLVSDMYWKKDQVIKFLKINEIDGFDNIYISCELNKSKADGTIWSWLAEKYPDKKILHIGDNRISDYEQAEKYGFEAILISSALEMFRHSKYSKLEEYVQGSYENSCILGEFIKDLFNNPFQYDRNLYSLNNDIESIIGKLCLGPVVLTYVVWLKQQCIKKNDDIILFFARDGYLLKKAYDIIIQDESLKTPKGIYFYTSRRAASVASIKSKEDIIFVLNEFCKVKKAKIGELIKRVFGIEIEGELANKYYYEVESNKLQQLILDEYSDSILINAAEERVNYRKYIENLEIGEYDNFACANFVGRGITQLCMQKILEKKLDGFYFGTEYDMHRFYPKEEYPLGLYGNLEEPCMTESKLIGNYLVGEMFFTAPDEQLIRFTKAGIPIFNHISGRNYITIEKIHEKSLEYITEMKKVYKNIDEWKINEKFIDEIYGVMIELLKQSPEDVKENFSFNDYYNPENENRQIVI